MKNKPGTVSPANITRLCRMENADYNKVEFIYANSTKVCLFEFPHLMYMEAVAIS